MTWAAVGVLVPIMVAGFGLLWQLGDRHHRDIEALRTGTQAGFRELRTEIADTRNALLGHFDDRTR